MAAIYNHGEVKNQVAGDQIVNGSQYFGPVNNYVSFERDRLTLRDPDAVDDQVLLASLAFPGMLDRRSNIDQPHDNTCNWVLAHQAYRTWEVRIRGLLWIKGKPGAGKSTLMLYLLQRSLDRDHCHSLESDGGCGEHIHRRPVVHVDFFFNARGTQLQHDFLGMLRALLNQLFRHDKRVRPAVREAWREKSEAYGVGEGQRRSWDWQRAELEQMLARALMTSAEQTDLRVFVDALDEAGEEHAHEIAHYMRRLNDQAMGTSGTVRFCISSRHYPVVSAFGGEEVTVENHNLGDIKAFIDNRFQREFQISDNESTQVKHWDKLKTVLLDRAQGIFLWVCLVLPILFREISHGASYGDLKALLARVPHRLDDVYTHILLNVIDRKYRSQSLLLFQWVCYARRPLTVKEMRWALAARDATPGNPSIRCHRTQDFVKSDALMKKRVRALSGGLIEVVPGQNPWEEIIQVIHQTVGEFLKTTGMQVLSSFLHSKNLQPEPLMSESQDGLALQERAHGALYQCCLYYLLTEDLPRYTTALLEEALDWRGVVTNKAFLHRRPLMGYVTQNIFFHSMRASSHSPSLLAYLQPRSVAEPSHRPASTTPLSALLHLAVAANMIDLVAHLMQDGRALHDRDVNGYTALHFASRKGHSKMCRVLIGAGACLHAKTAKGETPLDLAARYRMSRSWKVCWRASLGLSVW